METRANHVWVGAVSLLILGALALFIVWLARLGGGAQEFMKGVAQVFLDAGSIPSVQDSYAGQVNTGPLQAVEAGQ